MKVADLLVVTNVYDETICGQDAMSGSTAAATGCKEAGTGDRVEWLG
jgi:hypothetical protein